MKHIININLSKDTPTETLTELYTALKTNGVKPKQTQPLYALDEDIEKLHARYEELFKQVKNSANLSEKQIESECETLNRKYEFELELLSKFREADYEIRLAEIKARRDNIKPLRRCRLWRLLLQPVTNRAQDIIEERAELDADFIHTAEEIKNENDRKKLPPDDDKKKSLICRLIRKIRDKLKKIDKTVNTTEPQTAPPAVPSVQEPEHTAEPQKDNTPVQVPPQSNGQLQGQITLDELPQAGTRRPRPPRSCRKS